ncbi:MAG: hypothetical protein HFJ09_03900 [Lachnospiraceae bacterium]|nr:hypothetical protein [Lachnospiraceae bacterium]
MFKEDYKKHYDEIHPSPELIERTKKMALAQYQSKILKLNEQGLEEKKVEEENYETEKIEYTTKEEKIIFLGMGKRKILQIAGGLAAGVALITVGYLFSGTLLKQQRDSIGTVAENTTGPINIDLPSSTPFKKEEGKNEETKKSEEKKKNDQQKQQAERTTTTLITLAKMGNGDGVRLDYASNNLVIFHGNFGILGYNLASRQLVVQIPAKKYQFPDMWTMENVSVNQEGTKIAWYGPASSNMEMDVYDIAAKTYSKIDSMKWQEENYDFSGIVSVSGSNTDVYSSKATNMCVKLSENRTCQLIYQAPSLSLQASLGIAIVDMDAKIEKIYDVFGNTGRQVAQSYGVSYGGYHNENGEKIFESNPTGTENPEETTEPNIEPTENVPVTESPVEVTATPVPEPTENVAKPEVTENSKRLTQSIDIVE